MKTQSRVYWLTNLPAPYRIPIFSEIGATYFLHVDFLLSGTNWRNWIVPNNVNFSFSHLNLSYRKISDFEFIPGLRIRRKELFASQIVVIGSWEAPQYLWTALVASVMRKKLILVYESTLQSQRYKNQIVHLIRSYFFKSGDLVISFGPESTVALVSMGVSRTRILELFNPIPKITSIILASEKETNFHRYLFVGQLIPRKNVEGLIRAFAVMRDAGDTLTIVGEGENKSILMELVDELDLNSHVALVGQIEPSEMNSYYPKFDTLVLPSFREVWGLVVNEALANGLHVVVSDKCGSAVFVRNMKGVYITDGSVDSLVKQLKKSSMDYEGKIDNPEIWKYDTSAFSKILIDTLDEIAKN
jgi:glycosyltransferase involved in cell wall biosynthesis